MPRFSEHCTGFTPVTLKTLSFSGEAENAFAEYYEYQRFLNRNDKMQKFVDVNKDEFADPFSLLDREDQIEAYFVSFLGADGEEGEGEDYEFLLAIGCDESDVYGFNDYEMEFASPPLIEDDNLRIAEAMAEIEERYPRYFGHYECSVSYFDDADFGLDENSDRNTLSTVPVGKIGMKNPIHLTRSERIARQKAEIGKARLRFKLKRSRRLERLRSVRRVNKELCIALLVRGVEKQFEDYWHYEMPDFLIDFDMLERAA
jgi:hypothetical protein